MHLYVRRDALGFMGESQDAWGFPRQNVCSEQWAVCLASHCKCFPSQCPLTLSLLGYSKWLSTNTCTNARQSSMLPTHSNGCFAHFFFYSVRAASKLGNSVTEVSAMQASEFNDHHMSSIPGVGPCTKNMNLEKLYHWSWCPIISDA